MKRPPSNVTRLLIVALTLLMIVPTWSMSLAQPATPVAAEDCVAAAEPNDQPQDALPLPSGEGCANAGADRSGQDLYRWEVTDAEAMKRWTFSLSAIPEHVGLIEIYKVEFGEA